jgi:hypothetical protein
VPEDYDADISRRRAAAPAWHTHPDDRDADAAGRDAAAAGRDFDAEGRDRRAESRDGLAKDRDCQVAEIAVAAYGRLAEDDVEGAERWIAAMRDENASTPLRGHDVVAELIRDGMRRGATRDDLRQIAHHLAAVVRDRNAAARDRTAAREDRSAAASDRDESRVDRMQSSIERQPGAQDA